MFSQQTALVIEGNLLSRSILVRMLMELGFKTVAQATKPKDALKKLEIQQYDFIFCEYYFEDSSYTGQVFIEDLRSTKILPLSSAFVMVTAEASQAKVSEAAESALDSYLLKPFNFNELKARLLEIRAKKECFKYVYAEIALNDFDSAASLCESMVSEESKYWVNAARIAAELRLKSGDFDGAKTLFDKVSSVNAVPWAKLGLARVDLDVGETNKAIRTLESLISENPAYADAHDLMGRAALQQGDFDKALEVYEKAVALTPSSLTRLQKLGALCFIKGDVQSSEKHLEKAFQIGAGSKMYDYQSLVLLALMRFDSKKDPKFIQSAWSVMRKQLSQSPDSFRLSVMLEVIAVLAALQSRQSHRVSDGIESLAVKLKHPDFDFEMACNFCSVLRRAVERDIRFSNEKEWLTIVGHRYCTTKFSVDILKNCVSKDEAIQLVIEDCFKTVNKAAQSALTLGLQGQCLQAVNHLIATGANYLNARILEVAGLVAEKYKHKLQDFEQLTLKIQELRQSYCSTGTQIGLSSVAHKKRSLKPGLVQIT